MPIVFVIVLNLLSPEWRVYFEVLGRYDNVSPLFILLNCSRRLL